MKIAVSYLKSDNYKKCVDMICASKADYVHCDLCDGKYVETKNFTLSQINHDLSGTTKPLDVHLMCKDPIKYVDTFAMLNTETITIHLNSCKDLNEVIDYIKSIGLKVGIALNPDEQVTDLMPYINDIDHVLVMSVVPGKGGQPFMESVLPSIDALAILKNNYNFTLAVDGGINSETINYLKNRGVDMVISGSYITQSEDYNEAIKGLK